MKASLEWGYDGNINQKLRTKVEEKWFFKYNTISRVPLPWREECINQAGIVRDSTDLPIEIFVSGGVDSIICCESFRLAGIPFTVMMVDYEYNKFDIKFGIEYCDTHNIKKKIIKMDYLKFLEDDLIKYCEITQNCIPHRVLQGYIFKYSDGYPIVGEGETWLNLGLDVDAEPDLVDTPRNGGKVITFEEETALQCEKMLMHQNRKGLPKFLCSSPEIKLSFLINPTIIEWIKYAKINNIAALSRYDTRWRSNFKNIFYMIYFPEVGIRPPIKYSRYYGTPKIIEKNDYTGDEHISHIHREYHTKLLNIFSDRYDNQMFLSYMDAVKQLTGNLMEDEVNRIEEYLKGC